MSNIQDILNSQNSSVANDLNNSAAAGVSQAQQNNDPIIPIAKLPNLNAPTSSTDSQGTQEPVAPQGGNGNWLTKILPTLGSIAAPVAGALLAPETGGASLLAGLALAGGGSAVGKAGENALEGQDVTKDLGASALEGTVGQLAGGAIGKLGGALLGKVGQGAEKAGAGMVQKQFGDQIDKVTAQHLIDHGVTNRQQAVNIANQVTGNEGHLPAAINNAFKESDRVANISDLDPTLIKASDNSGIFNMDAAGLTPGAQTTALANVQKILNSHMGPGDLTKIPGKGMAMTPLYANGALHNALPEDVFSMAQQFEKLGYGADAKAFDKFGNTTNADQADLGSYYKNIANTLNERAFGVGQDAIPLSDTVKKGVIDNLSGIQKSNPQAYSNLTDQVNNATNLQDLRSIQAPWVKVGQGDRIATAIANGQGGISAGDMLSNAAPLVGGATGGVKGLATGLALKAMNSPAGNAAGANTLNRVSNILASPNMQKVVTQAVATPATQLVTHAPTDFTGAAGPGQAIQLPQGADAMQNPNLYSEVMNSNNLNALPIQAALIKNMFPTSYAPGNALDSPEISAALGKLQGTAGAQAQLPELIQAYNAAGGAQGAAGGILANLGGMLTGGPAAQYQARANALQKSILESTGQNVQMPSLSSNQEAANSLVQQLLTVLQRSGTPNVTAGLPAAQ